jgi:hypothetical protein
MSSSCLSNCQYIVPPICKILVNCEHILSCYMSKASLKKLGLYARPITYIDLVTRVIMHHLHVISGFHYIVDEH